MKYDKVIRAGINGCGNIVVEQTLNYLFGQTNNSIDRSKPGLHRPANVEDIVIHTFRYIDNLEPGNRCHVSNVKELNIGIVIPIRDFRSALASQMRKRGIKPTKSSIRIMYENLFLVMYREMHKYKTIFPNPNDVLVLDYHKYFGDMDYLIEQLKSFLQIDVTEEQKAHIRENFSIEVNKNISTRMHNWSEMDTSSGIHGRHIGTGEPESWKTFFSTELHEFVTELMRSELTAYGWGD